jgi:hypothetical protein
MFLDFRRISLLDADWLSLVACGKEKYGENYFFITQTNNRTHIFLQF